MGALKEKDPEGQDQRGVRDAAGVEAEIEGDEDPRDLGPDRDLGQEKEGVVDDDAVVGIVAKAKIEVGLDEIEAFDDLPSQVRYY